MCQAYPTVEVGLRFLTVQDHRMSLVAIFLGRFFINDVTVYLTLIDALLVGSCQVVDLEVCQIILGVYVFHILYHHRCIPLFFIIKSILFIRCLNKACETIRYHGLLELLCFAHFYLLLGFSNC